MIPRIITDTSITFIARARAWVLAADHPNFAKVREILTSGDTIEEDALIHLTDVTVAVGDASGGEISLTEEGVFLHGEQLPTQWAEKAASSPDAVRVLLVSPGDRVRIEGDPDAPDGIYTVGETDTGDVNMTIYVESDEGFFGFVANESIKEIVR